MMVRWRVIVARNQPALWVTWTAFYGSAGPVEVLVDRRRELSGTALGGRPDRRHRPHLDSVLREQGFVVIPSAEMTVPHS